MPLLCTSRIDTNDVLIQSHRHADTAIATYRHRRKKSLQVLFLLTLGMPLGAVPPHLGHALVFLFLSLCGGSLFCEIPCYYVIKLFKNMKQYFMMIGMEILFTFLLFSSFSAGNHLPTRPRTSICIVRLQECCSRRTLGARKTCPAETRTRCALYQQQCETSKHAV